MLVVSRRSWLATAAAAAAVAGRAAPTPLEARIARLIQAYEEQGLHRTGTLVDRKSAEWLSDEVRRAGLTPGLEDFALNRVDPVVCVLAAGNRRIQGLPLFDGGFTDPGGVTGRLGSLPDGDAEIGLTEAAPNTADAGTLGAARRKAGRPHKAIVVVTRGGRPGLCPSNADSFLQPFGPPVLQVSSEHAAFLAEQRGSEVRLIAHVKRTPAVRAYNVTARIAGRNPALPPLVVMTPRSGWFACASERGGGLACWLELMRTMQEAKPAREVLFVASSGHELGYLGINAYVERRPGIVKKSAGWMHFGANIGAATDAGTTIQASDDAMEAVLSKAMNQTGVSVDRRRPRGAVPRGEAEVAHRGGGRYVSVFGYNALFHNPQDRGPQAVDPAAIARFTIAFAETARTLALNP